MVHQLTSTRSRRRWQLSVGQLVLYAVMTLIFLVTAYPFFYILSLSVMPYEEYVRRAVHIGPAGFTLIYYQAILSDPGLVRAFGISILKTSIGTVLNVVVTAMAGYALSRQLKLRPFLVVLFLIPMFIGGGLIPFYLVVRALGLLNTFWALILPGLVGPYLLFVVRTYFQSYPHEVIESALIDGANQWTIFWRIVWPTSTPILATIALLYGTGHWNDFFWPNFLVQADLHPASVALQNITANRMQLARLGLVTNLTPQSLIAAVASVLIIPVLVIYPLLQRYVVQGILVGSLKG
jgi:putative aldouronate transport system permease protein